VNEAGRALPQTVLRAATDRRLLEETIRQGRTTRVELADATGYSRPTVSEAVRRLVARGLLDASGLKETGRRGRVGTFYSLGARAGWVLALTLDASGVEFRATDLAGRVLVAGSRKPGVGADAAAFAEAVRFAIAEGSSTDVDRGPLRAVGVALANPVHPRTHKIIRLSGSPFPDGMFSPAQIIGDLVAAPVLVDNDVNLAALAEHRTGKAIGATSFAYVYVGPGLGVGLYLGDQLIRGAHGLAGEIGYLPGVLDTTIAADLYHKGLAVPDVPALLAMLDRPDEKPLEALADAVGRAIISVAAVVDPELVLLGGPLGTHAALLPRVREMIAGIFPGAFRVDKATLGAEAPLQGAVEMAAEHARTAAIS
jgi:predicted NBD/HSP70 family sugar kinase